MLKTVLGAVAAGAVLVVATATPACADPTNLGRMPSDKSTATGACDDAACLVSATDEAGKDRPVPKSPTGQPLYTCEYTPAAPQLYPTPDPHQGEQGTWVMRRCTLGAVDAEGKALAPVIGEVVWQPASRPSTAALAQSAYRQLKPPTPLLTFSPPPTSPEVVGMPLWLAVSPTIWNPIRATASVGTASVTATATPVAVTWSMGDGHDVVCHGPGTPYPVNATSRTPLSSPTCGYSYLAPSAYVAGGSFTLTATVLWHVELSGTGGLKGMFADLRSSASTQVKVIEVQALVTEVDR